MKEEKDISKVTDINPAEEIIIQRIFVIRDKKVMFDSDLARLYGIKTKRFNEQIKRNIKRFPQDFMFRISDYEYASANRSQIATGSQKHRDPKYLPYVFTEHGVAMLSSILNSEKAIQMNILIIRVFIKAKELVLSNKDLEIKVGELERKQNEQGSLLTSIHTVVKHLIEKPEMPKKRIGFEECLH